jgi:PPP family 3-phenylpropionic acid transporter
MSLPLSPQPPSRLGLALRLTTFHAATNSAVAILTSLWPLFLAAKGLTPVQIGLVLASASFVKIVSNPAAGWASDRLGERRLPLVALAVIALIAYAQFAFVDGFGPLLALTIVASGAFTALTPLGDNYTMLAIADRDIAYGHVRVGGSIGFMIVAGLASDLLIGRPPMEILWALLAGLVFTLFACWWLPKVRGERVANQPRAWSTLLRSPIFLLFLGAATLNLTSHTVLNGFATLHWKAHGLSGGTIGALWVEGVAAEILFFTFGHRLVKRIGPAWLLFMSGAGGILRWTVTGLTVDPIALASVQWLHCMTFAATHLAAMYFIQRAVPVPLSGRAQAIYSSVALGLNYGLMLPVAGFMVERIGGGDAFLSMTLLSAGGMALSLVLMRKWKGQHAA